MRILLSLLELTEQVGLFNNTHCYISLDLLSHEYSIRMQKSRESVHQKNIFFILVSLFGIIYLWSILLIGRQNIIFLMKG